jgi:hypothetical protein
MTEKTRTIAAILERAERVHGIVTEKTGGADPDWALFYAWWLVNWSDLPAELGKKPGLTDLAVELVRLDGQYRAGDMTETWPQVYARELLVWSASQPG